MARHRERFERRLRPALPNGSDFIENLLTGKGARTDWDRRRLRIETQNRAEK